MLTRWRSTSKALNLHIWKVDLHNMQVLCEKAEQLLILQITVNPTSNLKPFCTISTCSMSSSISCSEEFPVYLRTNSYLISKFLSFPSPVSTCGQSPVKSQPLNYLNIFSRIVGGRQVAKGSYPWQVSLRKPSLVGLWAASIGSLRISCYSSVCSVLLSSSLEISWVCIRIQEPPDVH